jgi:hypothetical protein
VVAVFEGEEATMKVPHGGKTYDVNATSRPKTYEVALGGDVVGEFVLEDDDTRVTPRGSKLSGDALRAIADEFVDRGGAPMGIA